VLILEHKQVNPFSNGEKLSKFCNTFFFNKRMWNFLAFLDKKLKRLVPQTWNFVRRSFGSCTKKTLENKKIVAAAVHCEFDIWNIQIFSKYIHNLDEQTYLDSVFKGYGQLVPSILITSFPQPVWIATDSLAI